MQNVHHHIPANIQLGDKKSTVLQAHTKLCCEKFPTITLIPWFFSEFSSPFAYSLTRP